jgi:hypothetical protein
MVCWRYVIAGSMRVCDPAGGLHSLCPLPREGPRVWPPGAAGERSHLHSTHCSCCCQVCWYPPSMLPFLLMLDPAARRRTYNTREPSEACWSVGWATARHGLSRPATCSFFHHSHIPQSSGLLPFTCCFCRSHIPHSTPHDVRLAPAGVPNCTQLREVVVAAAAAAQAQEAGVQIIAVRCELEQQAEGGGGRVLHRGPAALMLQHKLPAT